MESYKVNNEGYYGEFGGAYVPEILYRTVEQLKEAYLPILESDAFKKEYYQFMKRLTGKRSIQSYNVKKDNREDVPVQTSSSLPQKSDLNFTNSKTFGNMIKG